MEEAENMWRICNVMYVIRFTFENLYLIELWLTDLEWQYALATKQIALQNYTRIKMLSLYL